MYNAIRESWWDEMMDPGDFRTECAANWPARGMPWDA